MQRFTDPGFKAFNSKKLVFCVVLLVCLSGCYGTEVVNIKVKVDSKVDMKNYSTIAVMDFVDARRNSITDGGKALARMIRKQLQRSKEFTILSESNMNPEMEENMDKDGIEDTDFLVSVCEQLGVDALIVGTFDLYQVNQPVSYIGEQYYPRTGIYRPEPRTYIQRVNRFSFHAKVIDGKTGQPVYDHAPPSEEMPDYSSQPRILPFSGSVTDPAILRRIAARTVSTFVLNLAPHYEYERRILVR